MRDLLSSVKDKSAAADEGDIETGAPAPAAPAAASEQSKEMQRAVQPSDELDERNSMTVRLEQTERIFQEAQLLIHEVNGLAQKLMGKLKTLEKSPCYRIAKSYRKTLNILRCSGDEGSKSAAGDEGDIEAGAPAAPAAPAAASEQSNEMQALSREIEEIKLEMAAMRTKNRSAQHLDEESKMVARFEQLEGSFREMQLRIHAANGLAGKLKGKREAQNQASGRTCARGWNWIETFKLLMQFIIMILLGVIVDLMSQLIRKAPLTASTVSNASPSSNGYGYVG